MGLIQKKDESRDEFSDIEVITRGEGPNGVNDNPIELVKGESAEDIAAGTTAAEKAAADQAAMVESAADEALMPEPEQVADDAADKAEEAKDTAEGAVEGPATEAADAAEGVADEAKDAVGDVAEGAVDAAEDAQDAADDAVEDAKDAAEGAEAQAANAAEGIEDKLENTAEDLKEKAEEATEKVKDEAEEIEEEAETFASDPQNKKKLYIGGAIVAVILAAVIGYFIGHGGFGGKGLSSGTISEGQLDTVVASYEYNGKTTNVTAREVMEAQYSLDSLKNDDGSYDAPSADDALSYARNQILYQDAVSRGIEVTDDEVKQYAENTIGTSDYSEMADTYGVTEDQAKEIVKQQYTMYKLYEKVVDISDVTAPTEPTQPADGNDETASKEYADYIINLAGDAWDKDKGTWKDSSSEWAKAFDGEEFTADSATYSQALIAYYRALSEYSEATSDNTTAWTTYANGIYAKSNMQLFGLLV